MTTPLEDDNSEVAHVTQTAETSQTTASSLSNAARKTTENEQEEAKKGDQLNDLTSDTQQHHNDPRITGIENPSTTQEGLTVTTESPSQHTVATGASAASMAQTTDDDHSMTTEVILTQSPLKFRHVNEEGRVRDQWYDEDDEAEENEETKLKEDDDVTMTDGLTRKNSTTCNPEKNDQRDKTNESTIDEGKIEEDEFAQFNDADYMSIDTEAFEKGKSGDEDPIFSSYRQQKLQKTAEAKYNQDQRRNETVSFMTMRPSNRNTTTPINIWVLVEVPDGNIEKYKRKMWHDTIEAMFEADSEVRIIPRNRNSRLKDFGAGEGKIPPMLFPDYVTQPKVNKTLKNGAVRYEFSFRIRQGIYIFRDLKNTTEVNHVLNEYNMTWFSSAINGSSRTRMGFIYGKTPNYCHVSNYAAWLRKEVPPETPPFDLRVEPQTYQYGASQAKEIVVKLFAASEDTDQVIAGVMTVLGDMHAPMFFLPRILSDDIQAKFLHQHSQVQRKMTRMDVPSHHLDRPTKIGGQMITIRNYVLNLKDPTGAPCRLDIEKISPKSQSKGKRGRTFLPTVLMIPEDCPSPNWSKKHVLEILEGIKYPGSAQQDTFRQAHRIPREMEDKFRVRAAQVPAPKVTYRGAMANNNNNNSGTGTAQSWASKVKGGKTQGTQQKRNVTSPQVAPSQNSMDDMAKRLQAMAKEQNAMKVKASNTGITIQAHTAAMESLKKSVADQDAAMKKTEANVGQVFEIMSQSQETQRAFQSKLDTLSGLSVLMYRVPRQQFPKEATLANGSDPLVEALAARLGDSPVVNMEERFAAEDAAAAMEVVTDDATAATVGTQSSLAGSLDNEHEDELRNIEAELARVSEETAELQQQQKELAEWSKVTTSPRRQKKSDKLQSPSNRPRTSTGVRLERSPGHNRYAGLAGSNKKKRSELKSEDDDSSRE